MSVPDEFSIFCERCGSYNVQYCDCIILDGEAYCMDCIEKTKAKTEFEKIRRKIKSKGTKK